MIVTTISQADNSDAMAKSDAKEKRSVAEEPTEEPPPKRVRRPESTQAQEKLSYPNPSCNRTLAKNVKVLPSPDITLEAKAFSTEASDLVSLRLNHVDIAKAKESGNESDLDVSTLPSTTNRRVRFASSCTDQKIHPKEREVHVGSSRTTWDRVIHIFSAFGICFFLFSSSFFQPAAKPVYRTSHLIPPKTGEAHANFTLRDFLLDPSGIHLGMAPSFFGFYGYFGALAAWEDELSNDNFDVLQERIDGVAGASAGAMAAVLLAAGIPPRTAAEFCTNITLPEFADFPGLLTIFRGNRFEQIMHNFLREQRPDSSLQLQDANIPVAVSGFDLQTLSGKVLIRGSMARAARSSATFPFLFQPVGWIDGDDNYIFVDGGIADTSGVAGLAALTMAGDQKKRVVNLVVGGFHLGQAPGPSDMPDGVEASEVLSISIQNLPQCGPWAMANGPLAVEGARRAMRASLDLPVYLGKEEGHYELHIDASSFIPSE
jgi:hypothetical protein